MITEVIEMTKSELEKELNEVIAKTEKASNEKFEAQKKELSGKITALEKELADIKEKEKNTSSFSNPKVIVKEAKPNFKQMLGMWGVAEAIGKKERKGTLEVLKKYSDDTKDERVKHTIGYILNSKGGESVEARKDFEYNAKSVGLGSLLEGSELAGADVDRSDFIELLRPKTSVQGLPFRRIGLINGQNKLNKAKSGSSASHVGSTSSISESNQTFEQVRFSAKKIASLSILDNDILRLGDPSIYNLVADDLILGIRQEWDRALLNGTGGAYEPLGLLNISGNSFSRTSSPDSVKIGKDLRKAKKQLADYNVIETNPFWITRAGMKIAIENQYSTAQEQMRYAQQLETAGTLIGYKLITSNNIPTGTDNSIILLNVPDFVMAEGYGITLDTSVDYKFNTDQTAIRGIFAYDFQPRHAKALCTITSVNDWETA